MRVEEEVPNKHQARTEQTRGKLLKSAYKVFAQDGFEAARLEDIAKDAGHTRGAFYAHFSSKEDLFFALLEQQIYDKLEKAQMLVDAQSSSKSKLRALREYYVQRLDDPNWSMLMLEFKLFAARHPKVRARLAQAHREMRASFQLQGIAGLLMPGGPDSNLSPDATRIVLEGLLQCLILQRAYDPISLSSKEASEALRRVFDMLTGTK